MIYTGADLIRTSGLQAERAEKLELVRTPEVQPASQNLDDSTQDALKRFARFINERKPKKPKPQIPPSKHPYQRQTKAAIELDRGQLLDILA